jgi:hypothetical protein
MAFEKLSLSFNEGIQVRQQISIPKIDILRDPKGRTIIDASALA